MTIALGSKAFSGPYNFKTRVNQDTQSTQPQTNPEELIGAAHAGCFSMALSAELTKAGFPPKEIHSTAKVHLAVTPESITISKIELTTNATIAQITAAEFEKIAQHAKENCPVSKALAAVQISLSATLKAE